MGAAKALRTSSPRASYSQPPLEFLRGRHTSLTRICFLSGNSYIHFSSGTWTTVPCEAIILAFLWQRILSLLPGSTRYEGPPNVPGLPRWLRR